MKTRYKILIISIVIIVIIVIILFVDYMLSYEYPPPPVVWPGVYQQVSQPYFRASCIFDFYPFVSWFYQFIVNPLCEIGIQIIPDYECMCGF